MLHIVMRRKANILGVSQSSIEEHTEVSQLVACEMAEGLNTITGADICVSVTGYAGPRADKDIPVGTVYIGFLADYMGLSQKFFYPHMNRQEVRECVCRDVFEIIATYLDNYY